MEGWCHGRNVWQVDGVTEGWCDWCDGMIAMMNDVVMEGCYDVGWCDRKML